MGQTAFFIASGVLALIGIGSFLLALRASYRIDQLRRGPVSSPRYTNVLGHAFGAGVPEGNEALKLQTSLRIHLLRTLLVIIAVAALTILR